MDDSSFSWTAVGAIVGALMTGFFGWLIQRSKGQVEETVAVRGEWSKLTDGLSSRLEAVEKAFAEYRISSAKEIADMKTSHAAEIAEIKLNHAAEMKAMRDLNEGLQRMISSVSQNSAMMIGDVANGHHHGTEVAKAYSKAVKDRDEGGGK